MSPTLTAPGTQLLLSYRIEGQERHLYAVAVPDEVGVSIIDVLAEPLPEDGDVDARHVVESFVPSLEEAESIAADYGRLAERLGWCPMHGIWW